MTKRLLPLSIDLLNHDRNGKGGFAMHQQVPTALRVILGHHEGEIPFMYLDHASGHRRVTTGVGCLLESPDVAASLPWHHKNNVNGPPVGDNVVRQEWIRVDRLQGHAPRLSQNGWAFQNVTNLRMQAVDLEALFDERVRDFARVMVRDVHQLRDFNNFPPDAQLAILVHGWAQGPRGLGPNLRAACEGRNWRAAAQHSGWGGGARKRLDEVRIMFHNAEVVNDPRGRRYETRVYWPERLVSMNPDSHDPVPVRTRR